VGAVVLAAAGLLIAAAAGALSANGPAGLRPGTLATLPGIGSIAWTCDAQRRVGATFTASRPITTQRVTLTADGKPLAGATLGVRRRELGSGPGRWTTLRFHVTRVTEPGAIGVTLTVTFRVLDPPTRQCLVPRFSAVVRTRSHAAG
jgi:hypothetical protein